MPRQRLRLHGGLLTALGRLLLVLPALALIYGGGVVLALAAGASPADVQSATAYQDVYDGLAGLDGGDWSDLARLLIAVGGVLAFVLLVTLAWAQRLTTARTRHALTLAETDHGTTTVSARALERAAELGARREGVRAARARADGGSVLVALHLDAPDLLPDLLRDAQQGATEGLRTSGLPHDPVHVTVTRCSTPSERTVR